MSEPYWVPMGTGSVPVVQGALVTALPGSPVDGQEVVLVDSLTAPTFAWHLRYVAAKASNRWVPLGVGVRLGSYVAAGESRTGNTYAAITTPGPIVTVPVAGLYEVEARWNGQGGNANFGYMSYDIGATAAVDADAAQGAPFAAASGLRQKQLAAGTVLTSKYRTDNASWNVTFSNRYLGLNPLGLGG